MQQLSYLITRGWPSKLNHIHALKYCAFIKNDKYEDRYQCGKTSIIGWWKDKAKNQWSLGLEHMNTGLGSSVYKNEYVENSYVGNYLVVQWLGLCHLTAKDMGLIPCWGTKILQATQHSQKKILFNFKKRK